MFFFASLLHYDFLLVKIQCNTENMEENLGENIEELTSTNVKVMCYV